MKRDRIEIALVAALVLCTLAQAGFALSQIFGR